MKRVPFGSIKSSFLKDCTKDVTLCHLSSCSSKTLQRSTYCSGEYSKYRVQVKIQLQTDNKLNVQLLGYIRQYMKLIAQLNVKQIHQIQNTIKYKTREKRKWDCIQCLRYHSAPAAAHQPWKGFFHSSFLQPIPSHPTTLSLSSYNTQM